MISRECRVMCVFILFLSFFFSCVSAIAPTVSLHLGGDRLSCQYQHQGTIVYRTTSRHRPSTTLLAPSSCLSVFSCITLSPLPLFAGRRTYSRSIKPQLKTNARKPLSLRRQRSECPSSSQSHGITQSSCDAVHLMYRTDIQCP